MRLRFGELTESERAVRQRLREVAGRAWSRLAAGDAAAASASFRELDDRLTLVVVDDASQGAARAELGVLESSAWPLAELVLEQCTADVGHALSLGRAPRELAHALASVTRAHHVDLSRATLRAGFSRGHLLELTLAIPGGNAGENEQIAAEALVRAVLGDRLFETWIGAVHVTAAPRGGPLRVLDSRAPRAELTLRELFDTVAAAALGVRRGLPERSWVERLSQPSVSESAHADWSMLEMEPVHGARGTDKQDLVLASTCTPELLRCYLDGAPCSSQRFSRHGERFVYLSYADGERSAERRVARRAGIEAALGERLRGEVAVTGVGLGLHTTYVDLALCNLETGLARLVSELRGLELPPQSFIQFFDSELSEEWCSISPDSRLTGG